jgi:CheY-like chemotaxis protein
LKRMRSHRDLQGIPVVVLTTSNQQADVQRCYDLGCNSFITKPSDISAFVRVLEKLESYWFDLVTLPIR